MVNVNISLDTKYFSSCLAQTRGKYDLFLFKIVENVQVIKIH